MKLSHHLFSSMISMQFRVFFSDFFRREIGDFVQLKNLICSKRLSLSDKMGRRIHQKKFNEAVCFV